MAKKRRKNGKYKTKSLAGNNHKSIIVSRITSDILTVPDFTSMLKRKVKVQGQAFVDASCIHDQVSLAYAVRIGTEKPKQGSCCAATYQPTRIRRRRFSGQPFVPSSCLTDSLTPVALFTGKKKATVTPNPMYYGPPSTKRRIAHENKQGKFVPSSCVTDTVAKPYVAVNKANPRPMTNVYPHCSWPVPDIIGGPTLTKKAKAVSVAFVPESCITFVVSVPYQGVKQQVPVKYSYIDLPNSPDILGPFPRKTKRKANNVIPFVPKSCTTEEKSQPKQDLSKIELNVREEQAAAAALARTAPETPAKVKSGTNWLPLVALIVVLLVVIGYITQK